jgi:predicted membrane protein (TIGR00267 family)
LDYKQKISQELKKRFSFRKFVKDESIAEIARRYFVMNAFDGALTVLGVLVGSYMANGTVSSSIVIKAGLGSAIAMGISGMVGAYLTERSERVHDMVYEPTNPNSPETVEEAHEEALFLALVDGLTPALIALIAVMPFFFSLHQLIPNQSALLISTILVMSELFTLGVFLGKIAKKNILLRGLITLSSGVLVFLSILMLPI